MHESEQYQEVQPYVQSMAMSVHSAASQLDLLREKLMRQAGTGLLAFASADEIDGALIRCTERLSSLEVAVTDLVQTLREEIA